MESQSSTAESPGPAAFACAYLNARADTVPPLLLALEGDSASDAVPPLPAHAQGERGAERAMRGRGGGSDWAMLAAWGEE